MAEPIQKENRSSYQNLSTGQMDITSTTDNEIKVMILVQKGIIPEEIVLEYGGTVDHTYEELNMVAARLTTQTLLRMGEDDRILHLERDKVVELKPAQVVDWPRTNVQAPNAWGSNFTGKGIKVAVIDSGVSQHEDLILAGGVSIVDYTASYEDDNGHGTHVAGIIGARNNTIGVVGIAPECELYAVKVLNQDGFGLWSDVIAGIDWAIQNKVDVINLSLGSHSHSSLMESMVNKAVSQNIIVVAAAGNSGTDAGVEDNVNYPARYPSVIAVGAVNQNNGRAPFSSTGESLELAAPGVSVLSTYLNQQYVQMDGTSSAAPIVAGVSALIKQIEPGITPNNLRLKLQRESLDLGNQGKDSWYGFGLVQAPSLFYDIYGHWAKPEILSVYEKGWMIGSNKYFGPEKKLTRAQAAVIFTRILRLQENKEKAIQFTDIPSDYWAKHEIDLVSQNEIMMGSNGQFFPEKNLTREQMVVMLYRAIRPIEEESTNPFTDVVPSRWSYKEIVTMNRLGVIKGVSPTTFAPINAITRGQMAVMLNRIPPISN